MKLDHIVNLPVIDAARFALRPVRRSDSGLIVGEKVIEVITDRASPLHEITHLAV